MLNKANRRKGIAIFGPPGSGKTTIANMLVDKMASLKVIGAAPYVIEPLINRKLPATKAELFSLLKAASGSFDPLDRRQAQQTFSRLRKTYGPDIIAKIFLDLDNPEELLVTGLRGYANAKTFQSAGFLVVYLDVSQAQSIARRLGHSPLSKGQLAQDYTSEETLYHTSKIADVATLTFNTHNFPSQYIAERIASTYFARECRTCLNTTLNPTTPIKSSNGLCPICQFYQDHYEPQSSHVELDFLQSFRGARAPNDVMVGISGGKDSTVAAYSLKTMGFNPLAFTFDTGYYPESIFSRSKEVANKLKLSHEIIDIRKYISPSSRESYRLTAELYDRPDSEELAKQFRSLYQKGRQHYSVKDTTIMPYVRTCQLCRKTVIPAYYHEAQSRNIQVVVLGINEWTCLSHNKHTQKPSVSGIRKLQPYADKPPVYVVHLPFLLRLTRAKILSILEEIGWKYPPREELVESNSNSCLFARAAENKARELLGFHPDITRLSREITVGFTTKDEAGKALTKRHLFDCSVREVLNNAGIL